MTFLEKAVPVESEDDTLTLGEKTAPSRIIRREFRTIDELNTHFDTEAPRAYNWFSMEYEDVEGQRVIKIEYEPTLES